MIDNQYSRQLLLQGENNMVSRDDSSRSKSIAFTRNTHPSVGHKRQAMVVIYVGHTMDEPVRGAITMLIYNKLIASPAAVADAVAANVC